MDAAVLVATFSSHYGCSADCLNDDARTCCLRIGGLIFLYCKIGRRETTRTYQLINLSLKQLNLTSFQIFSVFGKGKLQHNFNSPGDLTAPPPRAISSFASPPTERLAGLVHCCSLSREEAALWEMAASDQTSSGQIH